MADKSSPALRVLGPRAILLGTTDANRPDALNNVNTTTLPDGAECWITASNAYFVFIRASTATAVAGLIVVPAQGGPGRWHRSSAPVFSGAGAHAYIVGSGLALDIAPGAPVTGLDLATVLGSGFSVVAPGDSILCNVTGRFRIHVQITGLINATDTLDLNIRVTPDGGAPANVGPGSSAIFLNTANHDLTLEVFVTLNALDVIDFGLEPVGAAVSVAEGRATVTIMPVL